ncbi:DegT/DnrJ/EryC1/StrS family aminotransferase [Alteromonas sp. CYL-A6]|uniref:DegT/DnrJ/EryC1/StrS family aminotransferase n=1 Tax=Alteromonas nitratireducens TaxID=3390813 RepID=UPI0034AD16CF
MLSPSPKRIRSIAPSITQQEIDAVTDAVTHGWFDNMSMHLDQFVEEFSAYCGKTYCLPVSHGTAAIHLALLAAGVGPGDEVIVPDSTWVASASPVLHIGATPVLVDVEPDTWCLCPDAFERAITEKTKAVVCVDLFGSMVDFERIIPLARAHSIVVIEDAAEGLGSRYHGKPAGALGDIGVYSFNATKLIMGGQGGMLVTDNPDWFEKAKRLSHHGIDMQASGKYYWSTELGFNYNWSNINAALALAQLRRVDELIAHKRAVFHAYQSGLADCPYVTLNSEPDGVFNCYWITCAVVDPALGLTKEALKTRFDPYNVDVRPFFYPLSAMPPFADTNPDAEKRNPHSYALSETAICLPSGYDLTMEDVGYVCELLKHLLNTQARTLEG